MTVTSKEHYEMMECFERFFKTEGRLDREPKELWTKGNVYQDGSVNKLFLAFRHGISFQKSLDNF